jgi:hypothetical protein
MPILPNFGPGAYEIGGQTLETDAFEPIQKDR